MLFKYFSLSGIFGKKFNVFEKTHGKITSFPDSIFRNYRNIEEIYLNCNCIKTIPKDISYLTKLRILNLAENDIMYIPAEIAKLQHLSELDIKKNDILSLPLEFENLCNLTYLDLSSNKFNNFPLGLMKLTRLIYLNLNDTGINIIPSTIKNLIYLKSLEMRDNCIEIIPSELSTLAKLEIFDVSANLISVLPMNIGKLKQLDEFWVDCCELTSLPESIGEMIKITHFSCCENLLISLSQSFTDLYNIVDLNLSQNSLCSLPIDIGNLINLVIFKVDDNQISVLPDSICKCNQLTELILTHNTFKQLPQQFGKLKKLYNLNVDMNELTSLPDSMCDCENLSILSVRRNLIKCLPEKIGQLQNLIVLDVSSNCLNHLPISLTNCHPKAIWLNENQSKSLIKLETEFNETENAVVVTCCLLPQVRNEFDTTNALSRSSASDDSASSLSVISETEQNVNIEQKVNHSVVNFNELPKKTKQNSLSRQNTPHPKELREAQTRLIRESKMSEVKNKSTSTNVREKYEIELIHSPIVQTINAENPIDSGISSNQLKNSFDSTSSLNTNNASVEIVSVYTKKADLSFIMPENAGLGISISGGVGSMPYFDNDHSIFISDVEQNGYAEYFGLQKNDKILYVNNNSFNNISHNDAVDILSNLRSVVSMCVERKVVNNKPTKINNHTFKTATIKCNEYQQFGFKAISSADCHVYPFGPKNSGIYISKV
ncbi:Protein soc-2, partial [Intoshia linei]